MAYALASFSLVALPPLLVLLPALVLLGITVGAVDPIERAVRQEQTPAPLGVFSAGAPVELVGLRGGLLAFAVGNSAIAAVVAFTPGVRHIAAQVDGGAREMELVPPDFGES